MKISELQQSKSFKLLQFGEPGSGKTQRACSAIKYGKVLILDTDNKFAGMVPRLMEIFGEVEVANKIEVEVITTPQKYKEVMAKIDDLAKDFSTIVVDTISRAFDLTLKQMQAENPKLDGRAIFGKTLEQNIGYLNKLLTMPQNIILNSHVGKEELADGSSKLTSTTPGRFGAILPGYFNEVHYLYINGNRKHVVQGEPSPVVASRTVLPKSLYDSMGLFKDCTNLSVFDSIAYKK